MRQIVFFLIFIILSLLSACESNGQSIASDNIVFKDDKGNQISLADLEETTGEYNWSIMDEGNIPDDARKLHQEARQHGGSGEYALGIEKLEKANELAPDWAYPLYDLAYTYLLQQDFLNALKYYKLTDEMEPRGFFTAKTARWALEREEQGEFQDGLYLAFMQIEWMESDTEKLQIAKAIVSKFPNYAPAWKVIASKSADDMERLDAIEQGFNADPDAETKGVLLINKALVLDLQSKKEEAKKILGEMIFSKETTLANIELAKFALSSIIKRD
jgi:tetratricopeptide (TPR) repeat protein